MKRIIIIFLVSIVSFVANAQRLDDEYSVKSPEVASLGMVNDIATDLYTGRVNISIPLFDLKYDNFPISVNLAYNAEGFKPNIQSGWVGQNWSLLTGGVITRVVKGAPDELRGYGLYYTYDEFMAADDEGFYETAERNGRVDTEPDEFHFSVNGISGTFYLNENLDLVVVSNPGIKADYIRSLGGLGGTAGIAFTERTFLGFVITDSSGNKYYFGNYLNGRNNIELSFVAASGSELPQHSIATSWYLSHIVPANSQSTIYYHYSTPKSDINISYMEKKAMVHFEGDGQTGCELQIPTSSKMVNYISHFYLKSIECTSWKLDFYTSYADYQDHPSKMYFETNKLGERLNWQKLDSIRLMDNLSQKCVKTVNFQYMEETSKRLFLKSVQETGKPATEFEYYNYESAKKVPFDTRDIDHWGFYTRGTNHLNPYPFRMIPAPLPGKYFNFAGTMYYPVREADFDCAVTGMLSKMVHPTGAVSEFTYEPSMYSYYMYYHAESSATHPQEILQRWGDTKLRSYHLEPNDRVASITFDHPALVQLRIDAPYVTLPPIDSIFMIDKGTYRLHEFINSEWPDDTWYSIVFNYQEIIPSVYGLGGGIRIKEIRQKEGYKELLKEYIYKQNFMDNPDDMRSSGYLAYYPFYGCAYYWIPEKDKIEVEGVMKAFSTNSFDYANGRQVGYSTVVEITKSKTGLVVDTLGYTEYQYTNFGTNSVFWDELPRPMSMLMLQDDHYVRTRKDFSRGKLLKKTVYDKYKRKLHVTSYEYDFFEHEPKSLKAVALFSKKADISPCFEGGYLSYNISAYQILNSSYCPIRKTIEEYCGDNVVTTTSTYKYNQYLQVKEEEFIAGDEIKKQAYTYPCDYIVDPYQTMVDNNLLSYIVDKKTYRNDGFVEAWKTDYCQFPSFYKPCRLSYSRDMSVYYEEVSYDLYDSFGNLLQYTDKNGMTTVVIWGYDFQQPIVEVKNINYTDLEKSTGMDFDTESFDTDEAVMNLDQIIREKLPYNEVTTYTHRPLVGVTSMKAPNGMTTYYDYDHAGRLAEAYIIENGIRKTLETYQYHYAEE